MSENTGRLPATVLAVAGLILSAVLEYVHVQTYLDVTADSFCTVGSGLDCHSVALSRFSVLLGVPLPLWGIVGFVAMATAAWRRSVLLLPLAAFATLASIALLVEEVVHVGAVCLLCEGVHLVCLALLVIAWRMPNKAPIDRDDAVGILVIPAAIWLGARILIPPYWVFVLWTSGPPVPTGVTEDGHPWIGSEDPDVTVHEFVDYACPHCAVASNRSRMAVVQHDNLRVVRRQQPRMRCAAEIPSSCLYVRAAACAQQQGKFWEMDSWLFAHAAGKALLDVMPATKDVGLDDVAFSRCLTAPETYEAAEALSKPSRKMRIIDTPTYMIDGQGDKLTPKQLQAILDERL
jgi:uncharacterized membrane protein